LQVKRTNLQGEQQSGRGMQAIRVPQVPTECSLVGVVKKRGKGDKRQARRKNENWGKKENSLKGSREGNESQCRRK